MVQSTRQKKTAQRRAAARKPLPLTPDEDVQMRAVFNTWSKGTPCLDFTCLIRHLRICGLVSRSTTPELDQATSNDMQIIFTQARGKAAKLSYDTFLVLLQTLSHKLNMPSEMLRDRVLMQQHLPASHADAAPQARMSPPLSNREQTQRETSAVPQSGRPAAAAPAPTPLPAVGAIHSPVPLSKEKKQAFDQAVNKAFSIFKRCPPQKISVEQFRTAINKHFGHPELDHNTANRLLKRLQYKNSVSLITPISFAKFCVREGFTVVAKEVAPAAPVVPVLPILPPPALQVEESQVDESKSESEATMVIELDPDTVDALEGIFVLFSLEHVYLGHPEEVLRLDGFYSLLAKVGLLGDNGAMNYIGDVEELFCEYAADDGHETFIVFDSFPQCLVTASQRAGADFSEIMTIIAGVLRVLGAFDTPFERGESAVDHEPYNPGDPVCDYEYDEDQYLLSHQDSYADSDLIPLKSTDFREDGAHYRDQMTSSIGDLLSDPGVPPPPPQPKSYVQRHPLYEDADAEADSELYERPVMPRKQRSPQPEAVEPLPPVASAPEEPAAVAAEPAAQPEETEEERLRAKAERKAARDKLRAEKAARRAERERRREAREKAKAEAEAQGQADGQGAETETPQADAAQQTTE